ncbi:hypothetical protein M8J76_005795 [Diaphorina citri]|nr:hypothetical protein M8J76_005795 [Diaphorina citri]KAI5742644.1 hypothetical protein M8J77_009658 [Diaphorina citri]
MVLNLKFQGLASIMETELNHNMDKIMRAGLNTPDHLKTDNAEFDTPNAQSMNSKLDKPIVSLKRISILQTALSVSVESSATFNVFEDNRADIFVDIDPVNYKVNKQLPEPPTKDSLIPVNFSTKATLTSEEN